MRECVETSWRARRECEIRLQGNGEELVDVLFPRKGSVSRWVLLRQSSSIQGCEPLQAASLWTVQDCTLTASLLPDYERLGDEVHRNKGMGSCLGVFARWFQRERMELGRA